MELGPLAVMGAIRSYRPFSLARLRLDTPSRLSACLLADLFAGVPVVASLALPEVYPSLHSSCHFRRSISWCRIACRSLEPLPFVVAGSHCTMGSVTEGGSEQVVESGHQDVVHDVAVDYYGKRLASCSSDRLVKVFAVGAGDVPTSALATLAGHEGPVWQVVWAHPKFGSILASCSYDRRVVIWREGAENEWQQDQVFQEHESSVNSICWAPQEFGLCLACGSSDGTISVLTHKPDGSWEKVKIEQAHPVGVTSVSWAPASAPGSLIGANPGSVQKLVSGGCDNTVKVWKFINNSWKMDCFPPLSKHVDWVRDVAWAPNLGLVRSTIASASQDGTVVIWTQAKDGDQWQPLTLNDFKTPVWRVSWSLTGNILAVSDSNNKVTLWKEEVDGEWIQVTNVQ